MCAFIQFIVLFLSCMLVVMFEALRHTLSHLHARGAAPHVVRRLSCCRICFVGPRFDVQRVLGLGPWAQGLACRTSCSGLWSAARMLLRRLLARLPVLLWCPSSRVCCVCRSACVYPAALACYVPRPSNHDDYVRVSFACWHPCHGANGGSRRQCRIRLFGCACLCLTKAHYFLFLSAPWEHR
jgi:hypothetical protein